MGVVWLLDESNIGSEITLLSMASDISRSCFLMVIYLISERSYRLHILIRR
nr:MAG TPA: hypothetical protein [Caudoviricetes sp.]